MRGTIVQEKFRIMEIKFQKYQGAGNDFILLDNRKGKYTTLSKPHIASMCNRHFGIGADGLLMLSIVKNGLLSMCYYNADGALGSMCGNGARCFILFADYLMPGRKQFSFEAFDGMHHGRILKRGKGQTDISVSMNDVLDVHPSAGGWFLDTGSPHLVKFVKETEGIDVVKEGREIRYSPSFRKEGTNVNFVTNVNNRLHIRTYERGVEDETLACGTGITAAAIAAHFSGGIPGTQKTITVHARGGILKVSFIVRNTGYHHIYLTGPARFVFEGVVKI